MSAEFKYVGVRNQNQLKNGRGTFEACDLMYKGSFYDGLSSGYGVLQLSDQFRLIPETFRSASKQPT